MTTEESTSFKQEIAKWCIIIAFAGFVFYLVYPKHFVKFSGVRPIIRVNQITGTTEVYMETKDRGYRWQEISSYDNKRRAEAITKEFVKKHPELFTDLDDDKQ